MRPTSASYLLVACLCLAELAGCGSDDSEALFGEPAAKDAGGKGGGTGVGGSGGFTTGGSSGNSGATGGSSGSLGNADSAAAGSAGADDSGTGGTDGGDQDASIDGSGLAGTGGSSGTGADAGADATLDAGNCPQPTVYYRDYDRDGFGDAHTAIKACQLPDGYVTNDKDCYDANSDAKPGQTAWFVAHRGDGSYDYDCNGTGVRRWTGTGSCPLALCTVITGWQQTIPNCGDKGEWVGSCTAFPLCQVNTESRAQECH